LVKEKYLKKKKKKKPNVANIVKGRKEKNGRTVLDLEKGEEKRKEANPSPDVWERKKATRAMRPLG